jgi:acetyltransferase EpsM
MANQPVILIGGGGHAGVVYDVCVAAGRAVVGVLDDDPRCPITKHIRWLGPIGSPIPDHHAVLIAVGDLKARRRIIDSLDRGIVADAAVHPSAVVSPAARLGPGAVVMPGAVINRDAVIGSHAIINTRAVAEHDCKIGENTHLAPGSVLGGSVTVGRDTLVGILGGAIPGVRIGSGCVIGAGAMVLADIADGERAVGVPARVLSHTGS